MNPAPSPNEVRLLSTTAILGYGFPEASLRAGMEQNPHMIGADGGSSDPGPYYLGAGKPFVSTLAMRRDLRLMLNAAVEAGIPMFIGTCGGAGGKPHVALVEKMVREIAAEDGLSFKMAVIESEQTKAMVKQRLAEGRVKPLRRRPQLDAATVDRAERIVALCGPEPYMRALDEGAQVVLGGRSSDPAPFAAMALRAGMPAAPSWYAGKMLECGVAPAAGTGPDCMLVKVHEDGIVCEPVGERYCTPQSVATFSLHENASPVHHTEPGGLLDTTDCTFDPITNRAVKVRGMKWVKAEHYTNKLEAAELVGHRVVSICGTRDPMLIGRLPTYLEEVRASVRKKVGDFGLTDDDYTLTIRTYGRDGVMSEREPVKDAGGHELGFLIDVVAADPEHAAAALAVARTTMLHSNFPGRLCKEGNMAFPFSPSDITVGPVYRFSMAHVVIPDDPYELFPIRYEQV